MEFHPLFLRYVIVFLSEFCAPHGGIILGRGKGRCPGSSDLIFLLRLQKFCSVSSHLKLKLEHNEHIYSGATGMNITELKLWIYHLSDYKKKVATTFSLPILKDYLLKIMYAFYSTVCFSLRFPVVAAVYMVMHAHAFFKVNISSYYCFFSAVESELRPEVCFTCMTWIITKMCYFSYTLLLSN